jgi:hypothetical protein
MSIALIFEFIVFMASFILNCHLFIIVVTKLAVDCFMVESGFDIFNWIGYMLVLINSNFRFKQHFIKIDLEL